MVQTDPQNDFPILSLVGRRVRRLRNQRKITAKELAVRSGLSPRFIAQLEAGQANIAIGRLARVAQALGVGVEELVHDPTKASGPLAALQDRLKGCTADELNACLASVRSILGEHSTDAIALVGLRGAGKSTLGPMLATDLGLEFVELDEAVEQRAGLTLSEIFALHGEEYYRRLEVECLVELLAGEQGIVLALSGGLPQNERAWNLVRQQCTTVWLQASPEDHMNRVLAQGDHRPTAGRENAMAELRSLLASRDPFYRQSAVVIDTSSQSLDGLRQTLSNRLHKAGFGA